MITLNHLVRKSNAVNSEDFQDYWLHQHATKLMPLLSDLGIKKYTKCETLHDDDANKALQALYGTSDDAYDFVDQMIINNLDDFRKGLQDKNIQKALLDIHNEGSSLVNYSRSDYWFSVDVAQIFSREVIEATWDTAYLKVFYVPQRLDKLSLDEAQLHWNACHGGMARQFAQFLPYDKYIQGHLEPSALVDKLKSLLGTKFEDNNLIIGQAEAWLDRRILPAFQGPEVERMMAMLVQDIDLFVAAKESYIFATKENVIHNQRIITEPIPSLFNAN